jgi:hypothetical protein
MVPAELLSEVRDLTVQVDPPETVLRGSLPESSVVMGLIAGIHALGLRLIEVRRLPAEQDPDQRSVVSR